ncbi:hypothetical protein PORY_001671 [Pneumocystis oryctolagi]|uniref:Uncharacterized protein n=1 Tax=Pneumocystis oryctolagi TaxID=42067 RepID=A0ACB7CB78_9ASCO|nr:hypothetical protein PORY_001671 [Pneumocystis oryctolagi]
MNEKAQNMLETVLEAVAIHGQTVPDSEQASFFLYAKVLSWPEKKVPLLYLSQDITYLPQSTRIYTLNSDGTAPEEGAATIALGIPVFESCEEGMSVESSPFQLSEEYRRSQQSCLPKYNDCSPLSSPIALHGSPISCGRTGLSSLPIQEIIENPDSTRRRSNSLFSVRSATLSKTQCTKSQKIRSNTDSPLKQKRTPQNSMPFLKNRPAGDEFLKNFCLLSSEKKENKKKPYEQKKWAIDVDQHLENRSRIPRAEKNNAIEKSTLDMFANDFDFFSTHCDESLQTIDTDELTTGFNKYPSQIATVELENTVLYVYFPTTQVREVLIEIEFTSIIHEATDLGADGRCYCLNLQCLPICRNPANIRFDLQKVDNKNIHLSDTQIVTENLEEGIDKSIIDVVDLTHKSIEKRSWQCFWQVHLDAFDFDYSGALNIQTKVDVRPMRNAVVANFSSNIAFLDQDFDLSKNILSMGLIQRFHIYGPPELQFVAVKSMGILHWKCDKIPMKDIESNSEEISTESNIYDYVIRITRKKEYGLSDLLIESEIVIPELFSTLVLASPLHVPYFKINSETIQFMKTSLPLLTYLIHPETQTGWKLISPKKDDSSDDEYHILEYQCISSDSEPLDIHIEKLSPLEMLKEALYLNSENYIDNVDIEIFTLSHSQYCLLYKVLIMDPCICDNVLLRLKHNSNPSFVTLNGRKMSSGVYSRFDGDVYILADYWLYKDSFLKFEIGWVKDISKHGLHELDLPVLPNNGIKSITINVDPDFGRIVKFNHDKDINSKLETHKISKRNIPSSTTLNISILTVNLKENVRKKHFLQRKLIFVLFFAFFVSFLIPFLTINNPFNDLKRKIVKPLDAFQRFRSDDSDSVVAMAINELNQRLNSYELYIKDLENIIIENSNCCRNFTINSFDKVYQGRGNSLWFAERRRFRKIFEWSN